MTDVMNIVFLTDVVNIVFLTDNALDIGQIGHLLVSAVLSQPILIIIFGID
jgi:hypothetical protein